MARLIRILVANVGLALLLAAASHYRTQIRGPLREASAWSGVWDPKEIALALTVIVAAALFTRCFLLFGSGGLTLAEARSPAPPQGERSARRSRRTCPPEPVRGLKFADMATGPKSEAMALTR